MPKKKPKILICPLDWGLGHAARCVVIINKLLTEGFDVVIAADNYPLQLLRQEFTQLQFVRFRGVRISYSGQKTLVLKMLMQIPRILYGIWREHRALDRLIKQYNIDAVISDNRFGAWNKNIFSVYITHQVCVQMPKYVAWLEYPLYKLHCWFINRYNVCWIPDNADKEMNISGRLSRQFAMPQHATFIGLLSRFGQQHTPNNRVYSIVAILSGVEPQRSILEKILIQQLQRTAKKSLVIRGKPSEQVETIQVAENITMLSHVPTNELQQFIEQADVVICRSGYSSVMDLVRLQKRAILVPTPAQTEQEYLAAYLMQKKWFYATSQASFELETAIKASLQYTPPLLPTNDETLMQAIRDIKTRVG